MHYRWSDSAKKATEISCPALTHAGALLVIEAVTTAVFAASVSQHFQGVSAGPAVLLSGA